MLFTTDPEDQGPHYLFTSHNWAVLTHRRENSALLAIVDRRTGHVRQLSDPGRGAPGSSHLASAGHLYTQSTVWTDDLVAVLPVRGSRVDLDTGRTHHAPLPFAGLPMFLADAGDNEVPEQVFAAAGGRLFTVSRRAISPDRWHSVVSSYTAAKSEPPTELAGVAVKDWPRACAPLADVPGVTKSDLVGEDQRIGNQSIPQQRCYHYRTLVQVLWVARTPGQATVMFGRNGRRRAGADQERPMPGAADGARLLRVGRYIVSIDTGSDDRDAVDRTVVQALRTHGHDADSGDPQSIFARNR